MAHLAVTKYLLHKNMKQQTGLERLRIALVTDLHNRPYESIVSILKESAPDMIAVAGDLVYGKYHEVTRPESQKNAMAFLEAAADVAPTFYSLGNHETYTDADGTFIDIMPIVRTGALLLDDAALQWNGINIGGLSSVSAHVPVRNAQVSGEDMSRNVPNIRWLDEFDRLKGFKILLCHQPEYYPWFVKDTSADIVLSGHAHGGQWRIFGQGIYAPGQGWFPKLTSGVHEERLVISRGLANTARIPRICNPLELVIIDVD